MHDPAFLHDVLRPWGRELRRVWKMLEYLPLMHARLPVVFSHGDPHPGIILWGQRDVRAAMDWEFRGPKHFLYDPALVIGCVDTEAPEAGDGPFVRAFLALARTRTAPCLIISPDEMNRHIRTVTVAPMTSTSKDYPTRAPCTFKKKHGHVVLDQIRAIDKERLVKKLGTIDPKVQLEVCSVLQRMFAF